MIRALSLSVLFLLAQNAFADVGSSHIIKAKVIFKGKEQVGYFQVWGYLYLTEDSLNYDAPEFTRKVRNWVYGDTIKFYSELIFVKDCDLTILPVDKFIRINKNDISKIYPLSLISDNQWYFSYTRLRSSDRGWVLGRVRAEQQMIVKESELCTYSVLYFSDPDSISNDLVKRLQTEVTKEFATGKENSTNIEPLLAKLRELKVVILMHCSPT
ncbi:hypothetical protein WBG78_16270 [Chryseolinea sp. T2]|uniref:hypothetical protein n=1 Tax=Chryseolinea sp. T2 TaxID=3129255 RepID=UPI0030789582